MIPDYFEAITAYRAWNVHPNGLLVGQAFASPWKPYEPHVAICNHAESMGHVKDGQWQDAPLWECDCGIHAHQTLKKAESRIIMERQGLIGFSRCPDTAEGRVWGELKLWGKVIVHEDGYRAQYAYPGKLYCEDPRLARIVSTLYGVPVDVIVLEVPNDKVEWDYLLPPMQWLNPQFNPSALSGVYKFWRNTPPAPTPVAPAVAKFVQQASLAQIKAIGATPWQQAQTQLQAKQFPMLTTDWQEMWKNGFKLKKKDEALLLPNTPPTGAGFLSGVSALAKADTVLRCWSRGQDEAPTVHVADLSGSHTMGLYPQQPDGLGVPSSWVFLPCLHLLQSPTTGPDIWTDDEEAMITTFQDYLDMVCGYHMGDVAAAQSPQFKDLLTAGCNLFETYSHTDQLAAMALMVGMLLGTVEGEPVPAWESLGVIITHKERLLQFQAQALVVFWDSMEARGCQVVRERIIAPKTKKAKVVKVPKVKGARVIQIASGKRKKKQLPGSKPRGSDWGGHGI